MQWGVQSDEHIWNLQRQGAVQRAAWEEISSAWRCECCFLIHAVQEGATEVSDRASRGYRGPSLGQRGGVRGEWCERSVCAKACLVGATVVRRSDKGVECAASGVSGACVPR